jgi:hypothetical protein
MNNILVQYATKTKNISNIILRKKYIDKINERIIYNTNNNINFFEKIDDLFETHIDKFINEYESNSSEEFITSIEFFNSNVTLSNWFDELSTKSTMGLLIKISTSDLIKFGICKDLVIDNITSTFYPVIDFLEHTMNYFDKNTTLDFGNINDINIISGVGIGDANSLIPLYINKTHWVLAKEYLKPMLGVMFSHNPFGYTKKYDDFIFSIFVNMTYDTVFKVTELGIRCYFALLRTCAQICFENKYSYGIRKYINRFINNASSRIFYTSNDYDKLIGQCLCCGYYLDDDTIKIVIKYCVEEILRQVLYRTKYTKENVDYIKELSNSSNIIDELDAIIEYCEPYMYPHLLMLAGFYYMNSIMNNIINKIGSFNKFIKLMEYNFSVIPADLVKIVFDQINSIKDSTIKIKDIKSFFEVLNIEYQDNELRFYVIQNLHIRKDKYKKKLIKSNKYLDYRTNILGCTEYLKKYLGAQNI